ncbi:MAG: type IV toxin-antitoxin system AbiEi family antitoxin domain-containing protein, partial [Kangiellaceae bacterium]|nr:type IV toxin-antitoxin system AbiEi family antitoxin domain-containing protein [Kangiellaceae bacterium]
RLNDLLLQCKSIKVKRLFLWLAERQNYAWFKKLDIENLNLGSGKRVIAKGGKLDKEYQITVPNHLYGK